jgi:hypothetical protein
MNQKIGKDRDESSWTSTVTSFPLSRLFGLLHEPGSCLGSGAELHYGSVVVQIR